MKNGARARQQRIERIAAQLTELIEKHHRRNLKDGRKFQTAKTLQALTDQTDHDVLDDVAELMEEQFAARGWRVGRVGSLAPGFGLTFKPEG